MATWGDLVEFIREEYRVVHQEQDEIRIEVRFEDRRTQVVILAREVLDRKDEWVQIASVCGLASDVNLTDLLIEIGNTTVVCGAVIMGEHVVLRHALPLENLQINEFIDPLAFVAGTADYLEEKFFGGDGY